MSDHFGTLCTKGLKVGNWPMNPWQGHPAQKLNWNSKLYQFNCYCVKIVKTQCFFLSVYYRVQIEYRDLQSKSLLFSLNTTKRRPEKTLNLDTFHAVYYIKKELLPKEIFSVKNCVLLVPAMWIGFLYVSLMYMNFTFFHPFYSHEKHWQSALH